MGNTGARQLFMIGLASLVGTSGCAAPNRMQRLPVIATRATSSEPGIKVALVFNNDFSSGTPIAPNVVVGAAHAFDDSGLIAAADGYPMKPVDFQNTTYKTDRPICNDWMVLKSTRDHFTTNTIDPDVKLERGETVYLAGYRGEDAPLDPKDFRDIKPEVVACRVLKKSVYATCPDCIVPVSAPPGDYTGFSGGPVAVIDESGRIRVWGMLVRLYGWRWPFSSTPTSNLELWILRLPHVEEQHLRMVETSGARPASQPATQTTSKD